MVNANGTFGMTDISLFGGMVRSDSVIGTGVASSIGAVGLHSDVTLTIPESDEEDPLFAGQRSLWRPSVPALSRWSIIIESRGRECR